MPRADIRRTWPARRGYPRFRLVQHEREAIGGRLGHLRARHPETEGGNVHPADQLFQRQGTGDGFADRCQLQPGPRIWGLAVELRPAFARAIRADRDLDK